MKDAYWRAALINRVVDGDTVDATIDAGMRRRADERLRLLGVNAPELHASDPDIRAAAVAAKVYVQDWIMEHQKHNSETLTWGGVEHAPFWLQSEKGDSFGRWLARVECQQGHCLNDDLVTSGNAVPFMV